MPILFAAGWALSVVLVWIYFSGGPSSIAQLQARRLSAVGNVGVQDQRFLKLVQEARRKPQNRRSFLERMIIMLDDSQIGLTYQQLFLIMGIIAFLVLAFAFALRNPFIAFGAPVLAYYLPYQFLVERSQKRREQILSMADPAIQAIGAGYALYGNFVQATKAVLAHIDEPLRSLLQRVVARREAGEPLEEALQELSNALGTSSLQFFNKVLLLAERSGGTEVAAAVRKAAGILSEQQIDRAELEAELKSTVDEIKVLFLIEIGGVLLFLLGQRDFFGVFTSTWIGRLVIAFVFLSSVFYYILFKRMIRWEE